MFISTAIAVSFVSFIIRSPAWEFYNTQEALASAVSPFEQVSYTTSVLDPADAIGYDKCCSQILAVHLPEPALSVGVVFDDNYLLGATHLRRNGKAAGSRLTVDVNFVGFDYPEEEGGFVWSVEARAIDTVYLQAYNNWPLPVVSEVWMQAAYHTPEPSTLCISLCFVGCSVTRRKRK